MSVALFSVAGIRSPAKTIPIAATGSSAAKNSWPGLFAIEIEFRAELSNHLHNVLRHLPQVARRWSAQEVARRWLTITKLAKCLSDDLPQPDPQRVEQLAKDKKKIQKLRRRLSNVSWFMGILCENIARRANAEDELHGSLLGDPLQLSRMHR